MSQTDADLLRTLHDQHGSAVWAFAVRLLDGDRSRAQDVVQETFLRAWRQPRILEQHDGSARSWLFTVARHLVVDDWRRTTRRPEVLAAEPPEPVDTAPSPADAVVDRELVRAALATLGPAHRAVIEECYLRGATVNEAAAALRIPPGTVKSRCFHALRALRAALDDPAPDDPAGEGGER
jgi:RNA polymerase sigma-70 factor (ECF subfamily)